jgi:mannose-1-phosphate guanylyltransferase
MDRTVNKHQYAVVVAGGRGTRLWPLSRKSLPKQMQKFVSDKVLIDETVERLKGVVPTENIYISSTIDLAPKIRAVLPDLPEGNIIVEPSARGTTVAFALLSRTIFNKDPDATIFTLASDHVVTELDPFREAIENAFQYIDKNPLSIALIGVKPNRPDNGLGYIKSDKVLQDSPRVYSVEKFVEKPSTAVAKKYVESGEYFWNAAYYCFKAKTLIEAYSEADPDITKWAERYVSSGDVDDFMKIPRKVHEIETINASKYPLALITADFSWSDIGNWQAVHDILLSTKKDTGDGLYIQEAYKHIDIDSKNSFLYSTDHKLVATVGLENLIIVSTEDALLIMNRDDPQKIKDVIELMEAKDLKEYL